MNRTDANGTGDHRRRVLFRRDPRRGLGRSRTRTRSTDPGPTRTDPCLVAGDDVRSIDMYGLIHEQLARQRHREACPEARQPHHATAWRAGSGSVVDG